MKQLNWYQIFGKSNIPDGRTVLPTDDIQIWLHCANIWNKTYTTLAEVLADTDTLLALITSNNAVDYMVRSTTWASGVSADSSAMSYIGLNNYCANTLLADATWCEAICNSTYFESVLNVKVPAMTSATTPEGEVIGTFGATIGGQTYYGWKCFDGNDSTEGIGTSTSNQIIGYMFTSSMCLKKVHLVVDNYRRWNAGAKLQGTNDGNTWTDIYTTDSVVTGTIDLNISNNTSYLGYRFANLNASVNPSAQTIQFYGREDV